MGFQLTKLIDPIHLTIAGTFDHKGTYNNATDYAVGDAVEYNGSTYIMYSDAGAGTLPTNATYWYLMVEKGDTGATGAAGQGVPAGGSTNQVLRKASGTDYDTEWATISGGGGATWGSITGTLSSQTDLQTALDAKLSLTGGTMTGTLTMDDGRIDIPADNYTISDPPIKFIYPDMTDDESSKGAIIEWGGVMDGASHPYGIATYAYQQNNSATFTAPSGYKKWAWVTAHYDSPLSTGEDVHQHLNFETVQSDWTTAVTRLQISFGEDVALVSFPNSHTKIFPDLNFQIGNDAAGAYIKHDTSNAKIAVAGNTPWNWTGTGGFRIGSSGAPAAMVHVERADNDNTLLIRNTGTSNTSANILSQSQTSGSRIFQGGVQGDTNNRISMEASGLIEWGDGTSARDTNLYRSAANALMTDDALRAGTGFVAPSSATSAFTSYNTADEATNLERVRMTWSSNVFQMFSTAAGTGTARKMQIGDSGGYLDFDPPAASGNPKFSYTRVSSTSASLFRVTATGLTGSSGTQYGFLVDPTINQSSTAAYSAIKVNITETATGSGAKRLLDLQVGGSDKFVVDNTGKIANPFSQTYSLSNVTTDRTYDANATTVNELADVLGTLINDLKATGII